jgi:uncharacterized DUF497 family protein
MQFEWDEAKNQANIEKHGIAFEDAQAVFYDPWAVQIPDTRYDYGESRFILIGQHNDFAWVLVVIYTPRLEKYRMTGQYQGKDVLPWPKKRALIGLA